MGRRRTVQKGLPPRMHKKGETYWHVSSETPRRWTRLDRDYALALRRYAEIEGTRAPLNDVTFRAIALRYRREVFPKKAPQTQRDNEKELTKLEAVFGHVPIDTITPAHVRRYLDARGAKAPVRANREKALLSHVFNNARAWGYTNAPNPCAGIRGHRETGRAHYVIDADFRAVWQHAHPTVQDAMELAYFTAQRPGDLLRMMRADIRDGQLWIAQGKTGKKLRIAIEGRLVALIERIQSRYPQVPGTTLLQEANGRPLTANVLRARFDAARVAAGVSFQFRDIRAKAASDLEDLPHAQRLLGHQSRAMTEHYAGRRKGELVSPVDRSFVEGEAGLVESGERPLSPKPA